MAKVSNSKEERSKQDFPVVGIGASAGGLEAAKKLLGNIPKDTGLAFVLIQHLAESQVSMLPEILSRSTNLAVQKVENGIKIQPNQVYVIPAGKTLTVRDGVLELKPKGESRKLIDEFFRSLAVEKKHKSIGIVLSGTGTDGTEGLKAIKAEGGITFAQDPKTALYPDMPQNAISTDSVYFILPPEQIAKELSRISQHPELARRKIEEEETKPEIEKLSAIQKIFVLLQRQFSVNFAHYKQSTILRRMTRRMVLKKIENIEEYSKYVKSHPEEAQALFDDLLIGVTEFFREPKTFTVLQEMVFPELFKNRSEKQPIRVWVPGCSTGEEVYSVAIALQEFLDQKMSNLTIQVFGTDVNEKNIEKARKGVYLKGLEDQVPEDLLRKFFVRSNGNYQIAKRIRDLCIFARHDIAKDPPFSGMDLIMCRNLLIYFDNVLQERVIPSFHYGLKPNGYLVLGEAEAVGKFASIFEPVEKKRPIYRKKATQEAIEFPIQKFEFAPREKREIEKQAAPDVLSQLNGKVDSLLTLMFVPATFIINSTLDVVSVRGQVQPYITMEPGAPSFSIAKVLRKELRPSVQTVIYRSRKENRAMQDTVSFTQDKLKRKVRIHIEPLTLPKVETSFFLLMLEELKSTPKSTTKETAVKESDDAKDQQIKELSEALESTKLSLQTSIEQAEATTEELRSAMEEIQSSNEELQSTNEELETAKEELQSTNEELSTVNSELKERNFSLTELSDDLRNLLDNIDAAIIMVDRDFRISRYTNPAQEFLRLIPSDVGRKITDIRLNVPVADLEDDLSKVIMNLQTVRKEIKSENGYWYQMRLRPYVTEGKKGFGAVITIIDINDLKKAEGRLAFQADLLENVQDAVVAVDKNFSILYWNRAAENLLGWTKEEVIGLPSDRFFSLAVSDSLREENRERMLKEGAFNGEAIYCGKDGSNVIVDVRSTVIQDKQGEIVSIVHSLRDVSERKMLEKKLEANAKYLERLAQERSKQLVETERLAAIGQIAGMVGHDIRNPLQAMISDIYLLKSELITNPGCAKSVAESLQGLEDNIVYINKIVADLQDYVKPLMPAISKVDIKNVFELSIKDSSIPDNVDVTLTTSPGLILEVDPTYLRRVLTNLILNSVQAMPNGGKLSLSGLKKGEKALITVEDTGDGIPEHVKQKLFTPMLTTKSKGQGFGLAVAKRLIEAQGGSISFESTKGKGTKFIIQFPLNKTD